MASSAPLDETVNPLSWEQPGLALPPESTACPRTPNREMGNEEGLDVSHHTRIFPRGADREAERETAAILQQVTTLAVAAVPIGVASPNWFLRNTRFCKTETATIPHTRQAFRFAPLA
jgi:hypothetical protein